MRTGGGTAGPDVGASAATDMRIMTCSVRWLCAAVAVGVLLVPVRAGAAVTVGSDLSKSADAEATDCAERCTFQQGQLPGAVLSPPPGVIVRWRIRAADREPVRLRIIRSSVDGRTVTASSEPFSPTGGDAVDTIPARLPISPGDRLGLDQDGTQALHALTPGSGARLQLYDPTLPDAPERTTSAGPLLEDLELLVNADVERDRDGDGFGDETQDACPTDPATTGLCPTDLSVRIRYAGGLLAVGYDASYYVTVYEETGLSRPPGTKVDVTVPAGGAQAMSFRLSGPGACTLGLPIACAFGEPQQASPEVSMTLRATRAGPLTMAATVRSDAPDPNPGNNTTALTVNVLALGACANTATGTSAADKLRGTTFGDRLVGLAGDDLLVGGSRDDCLFGGRGDDRLRGEAGADLLRGGPGVDRLDGGPGRDRLDSRDGRREVVRCGTGRDRVRADRRDRLVGCEQTRLPRRR